MKEQTFVLGLMILASIGIILVAATLILHSQSSFDQYGSICDYKEIDTSSSNCKWGYENLQNNFSDMRYHAAEIVACCKARGVEYSPEAEPMRERIFVVNPDGSKGEEVTCAYYPEDPECAK